MASAANRFLRVALDILLVLIFGIASVLRRYLGKPFHRGFFQNDESLMHPYRDSTVPAITLYTVGILVPCFVEAIIEAAWLRHLLSRITCTARGMKSRKEVVVRVWLWRLYRIYLVFFFGFNINILTTNLLKYFIGRLRPHFIAVCKPNYKLLGASSAQPCYGSFIEKDICTGDSSLIEEARLSFPSGHASISMYCAIFFILYLEERLTWQGLVMFKPSLQATVWCLAAYVCCTRISDYKHHWSDVLGGAILGTAVAWFMVTHHKKKSFPRHHKTSDGLDVSLLALVAPDHGFEDPTSIESCTTQTSGRAPDDSTNF